MVRRPGARTSADYVIRASDGLVVQMVDEREAAFHDACFNDATIGVEHEGFTAEVLLVQRRCTNT